MLDQEPPTIVCSAARAQGPGTVQTGDPSDLIAQLENTTYPIGTADSSYQLVCGNSSTDAKSLPDLIVRCDPQGRFLSANESALRVLGRGTADPIGKTPSEIGFDPDFCRSWQASVQRVFARRETLSLELSIVIAGRSRVLDMRLSPEYSKSGAVNSVLGIARDSTERRQAELALRRELDKLEQQVHEHAHDLRRVSAQLVAAVQVKHEFLSTMSHELRTPLNAILLLSQMMLEGVRGSLNEHQLRAMQVIAESGDHLLAMVNDILDIAAVRAGTLTLDCAVHDVGTLCASQIDHFRAMARHRHQVIDYFCPQVPLYLWVDRRRFDQIVRHLLENAMKFTPDGGRLTLAVAPNLTRRMLQISVQDTGIGIAQDVIEQIFEPFVQADTGLSRQYEGMGSGLTLVHHLVELQGGIISVESSGLPGSGSRFIVELPWHAPPMGSAQAVDATLRKPYRR